MRVLIVNDDMGYGGAQTYVVLLGRELSSADHSVTVIADGGPMVGQLAPPVTFLVAPLAAHPLRIFRATLPLLRLLRSANADVVHANALVPAMLVKLTLTVLGRKTPVVLTIHKMWELDLRSLLRPIAPLYYRLAAMCADVIIALNTTSERSFRNMKRTDTQTVLIRNATPVDIAALQQTIERRCSIQPGRPREVIFVGRLVRQKRIDLLLRAIAQVPSEAVGVLRIVGDGPLRPSLMEIARCVGIADRVVFEGYSSQVPVLLMRADIFAVTSEWEGISYAMLEALASCLPMVCFSVPGVNDVVLNDINGIAVPFGDVGALATGIAKVATSIQDYQRFSLGAARLLREDFDIGAMTKATVSAYHAAVALSKELR